MAEPKTQHTAKSNESVLDRFRRWGESIFNNIDQINFFGRLKDASKILEAIATGASIYFTSRAGGEEKPVRIRVGRMVDALNGIFQIGLSYLSNWDDKIRTVRTYEKLVKEELGLDRPVVFSDLKRSNNPMIRDTAEYYARKSLYRLIPDFFNFIRFIPLGAKALGTKAYNFTQPLEEVPGITASLGLKAVYFGWYFTERQTGSHYVLLNLWNKTEGVSNMSNRALNQNFEPGDFIRWQEVRKLYECLRKEQPQMKLAEFTPDDPLTSRVFEQAARYLNHSYMPKLFAIAEQKEKQKDLQGKYLSHAMLVDLVGSGGLRVEDALGSAIRLEVMAHYGEKNNISAGLKEFRRVSEVLNKIKRPTREAYATQDEAVEALHTYFAQLDGIAREFLGDAWPPKYIEEQIKPGYIEYFFKGSKLEGKEEYLTHAFAYHDNVPQQAVSSNDSAAGVWANNRLQPTSLDKFEKIKNHTELAIPSNTLGIGAA